MILFICIGIVSVFCFNKSFPTFVFRSAVVWSTLLGILANSSIRLPHDIIVLMIFSRWFQENSILSCELSIFHYLPFLWTPTNTYYFLQQFSHLLIRNVNTIRLYWLQQTKQYSTNYLLYRSAKGITPFRWSPYVKTRRRLKTGYTIQNSLQARSVPISSSRKELWS